MPSLSALWFVTYCWLQQFTKSLGACRLSCLCALQSAHHSLLEWSLSGEENNLLLCTGSVSAREPFLILMCVLFPARSWKSFWKSLCDFRVHTTPSDIWRQTRTTVCQTYIPVQVKIWYPKMQIWFRRESFWICCWKSDLGLGLLCSSRLMQVDPPAFKKSRHECSHFLRQLGNAISRNLRDVFKEAAVDVLLTPVCEELELLWRSQPSVMHTERFSASGWGANQHFWLCLPWGRAVLGRFISALFCVPRGVTLIQPGQREQEFLAVPRGCCGRKWFILQDSISAWFLWCVNLPLQRGSHHLLTAWEMAVKLAGCCH